MNKPLRPTHTDPFYLGVQQKIDDYGQTVIGVFDGQPMFAYSIGLAEKVGFEIIIVGLRADIATYFINEIASLLAKGGELQLDEKDMRWAGNNMPTVFKLCDPALVKEYSVQAFRYYDTDDIAFYQMVMPDKNRLMPWEEGYDEEYMGKRQKALYNL